MARSRKPSTPPPNYDAPSDNEPAGAFDFQVSESSPVSASRYRRKATPWWRSPLLICFLGSGILAGISAWVIVNQKPKVTLALKDVSPIETPEGQPVRFRPAIRSEGVADGQLHFELIGAPDGATIDAPTGDFEWTPSESQGPNVFSMTVRAVTRTDPPVEATCTAQVTVIELTQPPVVGAAPEAKTLPGKRVSFLIDAKDVDIPAEPLEFELVTRGDTDATVNKQSGEFVWQVPADVRRGEHDFSVRVTKPDAGLSASLSFSVEVESAPTTLRTLADSLRARGVSVETAAHDRVPQFSGDAISLTLFGEEVVALEYDSTVSLEADARASAEAKPEPGQATPFLFKDEKYIALYRGENPQVLDALRAEFGSPVVEGAKAVAVTPTEKRADPLDEKILALYRRDRLATPDAYPVLRSVFTEKFQQQQTAALRSGWAADQDDMLAWLDERPDIKEELFTAIDAKHDRVESALSIFRDLRKKYPKQIEPYAQLAIATALVWDEPRGAVYEYGTHQRRTNSTMPGDQLGMEENFQFFLDTESVMQGRAKFLPWEFLVFLVNHRTAKDEREWALKNYLPKRVMFGKVYKDVPYDVRMLETSSAECKLDGKEYNLPNIREFGGVCAMQADFAARVGKSLGVPAAYVTGDSRSGDKHAWVMWVELLDVKKNNIRFSLESYGRYRNDHYYIGDLRDPHTGLRITDRQLEQRLHTVGMNSTAKRHVDLAMRALPMIRAEAKPSVSKQIQLLSKLIALSPGSAEPWVELAKLSNSRELGREERRMLVRSVDKLFATFANFPDFTWVVFGDLISYEQDKRKRNKFYERLVAMYEAAGRPDLSCEARLKLADLQVEIEKPKDAIAGLAFTVMKFVDEGQYVPRMLDKLEAIHKQSAGDEQDLITFYQQFLPKIPRTRGGRPSKYCIAMYRRGIKRFEEVGRQDLAGALSQELAKLEKK